MMKDVLLRDLAVGAEFTHDGKQYIKIEPIRINCCSSYNAEEKGNAAKKIALNVNGMVQVDD